MNEEFQQDSLDASLTPLLQLCPENTACESFVVQIWSSASSDGWNAQAHLFKQFLFSNIKRLICINWFWTRKIIQEKICLEWVQILNKSQETTFQYIFPKQQIRTNLSNPKRCQRYSLFCNIGNLAMGHVNALVWQPGQPGGLSIDPRCHHNLTSHVFHSTSQTWFCR